MFEDALNFIREVKSTYESLESIIEEFKAARDDLTKRQIPRVRRQLKARKDGNYPIKYAEELIKQLLTKDTGSAYNLLIQAIEEAIQINDEFERTPYRASLFKVANSRDIYTIRPVGSGWNTTISVFIDFGSEAGSLIDWAKGIDAYRDDLKTIIDEDLQRGAAATAWWLTNVYRTSLEAKTILTRLGYSGKTAPFWQILNSGSQPLDSDRGDGSYNPVLAEPTDFVGKAETNIKQAFDTDLAAEKEAYDADTKAIEDELAEAERVRDLFNEEIKNLKTPRPQGGPRPAQEGINQLILKRLGALKDYADDEKVIKFVEQVLRGEAVPERIELTRRGSGKRARLRTTQLIREIEGQIDLL